MKGFLNEHLEVNDFAYIDRITLAIKYYVNYVTIISNFFCYVKSRLFLNDWLKTQNYFLALITF